ncbi:hypothetical protein CF326_g6494 [Tilletia indica]|nr:hypothetical protein CF326_g6494 [Tilletia indica]
MPPHNRKSHPSHPLIPTEPYHPSPSPSTYRDILIFEERIKQAAARYTRRKRKYQTLLTFLLAATLTSAYNAAANSPQWSGIVDLALRWAADPDTDYRTGLGNELQHHFRVRKAGGAAAAGVGGRRGATDEGLSGVRGAFANRRRGGGGGAAAAAAAASKVKGVVWDIADAGSAAASAAVSAATAAALSTTHPPPTTTPNSADATLKQNKGKARAFHFRTGTPSDSPLISSISSKTAAYSTSPQTSPTTTIAQEHEHEQAAYYADGAAMLRYYLWVGLFLFFSTTTFLFFASGLYSERIAAGATFVPQANRALRHYHLYLNTRTGAGAVEDEKRVAGGSSRPALSRATSWIWWPPSSSTTPDPPSEKEKPSTKKKGRFSDRDPMDDDPIVTRAPSTPLRRPTTPTSTNQPPPSSNPRGELLLGPRVHPEFRAGYERYRAEFERRRAMRIEAQRKGRGFGSRAWRAVRSWVGLGVGSG